MRPTIGEKAKSFKRAGSAETRGHVRRVDSSQPELSDKTVSGGAERYDCCRLKSVS